MAIVAARRSRVDVMRHRDLDADSVLSAARGEVERLSRALEAEPGDVDARARQAALSFAFRLGDPSHVLASLQDTLRLDPRHGEALYWLASAYFDRREPTVARPFAERAVDVNPDSARYWLLIVSVLRKLDHTNSEVLLYTKRAVDLAPDWPITRMVHAIALQQDGQFHCAETELRAALRAANSVAVPSDPLQVYVEVRETGRLGTDTETLQRMLSEVRRRMRGGVKQFD